MLVCGFDTETTGLSVENDHIIQIGAVLWDTEARTKKAKVKLDAFIKGDHVRTIDPASADIHGICADDLDRYGVPIAEAFSELHKIFDLAEYIVAHNGNMFDKPIYLQNCARHGIETNKKPWIDTTCDIEFPASITTRKLVYLATEHGFLNPFPHDAISDVLTMLQVADKYDWQTTVRYSKAPTVAIQAVVSFQQKELAKKQNFRWDNEKKIWVKSIKDFQLEAAKKAAQESGFKLKVLNGGPANV